MGRLITDFFLLISLSKMSTLTVRKFKKLLEDSKYEMTPLELKDLVSRIYDETEEEEKYQERLSAIEFSNKQKFETLNMLAEKLHGDHFTVTVSELDDSYFEPRDDDNDQFGHWCVSTEHEHSQHEDHYVEKKCFPVVVLSVKFHWQTLYFTLDDSNKLVLVKEDWYASKRQREKTGEFIIGDPTVDNIINVIEIFKTKGKNKCSANPTLDKILL